MKLFCSLTALLVGIFLVSATAGATDKNELDSHSSVLDDDNPSAIPGPFDCRMLTWLDGCQKLNDRAQKHPQAPIRVHSKQGIEFTFPPGTPTVMISHILDPSPQSAKALADDLEARLIMANLSALYWNQEIERRGGSLAGNLITPTNYKSSLSSPVVQRPNIKYKNVKLYSFMRGNCRTCSQYLQTLENLHKNHPALHMRVLLIDAPKKELEKLNKLVSFPVTALDEQQKKRYEPRLNGAELSTWIQDSRTDVSRTLEGDTKYSLLERLLAEVSR